jgi:hypothetical protein
MASRTVSYTLDYNTDLSAPALALQWPSNGVAVSGDTFTMRGTIDNPSAGIVDYDEAVKSLPPPGGQLHSKRPAGCIWRG